MSDLTLLLNAAEQRLQFGLVRDKVLLCAQDWLAASRGVELLAPLLSETLKRLELAPSDITRIACVNGPGGFTGLRLALSTASALHHALRIPLAGINYLHLLAEGVPAAAGQKVRVLTNARRDLVYLQNFLCCSDGHTEPQDEPRIVALSALLDDLDANASRPDIMIGSGVIRHYASLAGRVNRGGRCIPDVYDQPHWDAFVRLTDNALYEDADLTPLYCRASEAEDNLEMLAERRGDDPLGARRALERFLCRQPDSQE